MALLWIFIFFRSSYNSWNISRYLLLLLCFYIGGSQTFTWGTWEKIQGGKAPLTGPGLCFIHLCSWCLRNTPESENHCSTIYMVLLVIVEFRNYLIGLLVRSALSFRCRLQRSPQDSLCKDFWLLQRTFITHCSKLLINWHPVIICLGTYLLLNYIYFIFIFCSRVWTRP